MLKEVYPTALDMKNATELIFTSDYERKNHLHNEIFLINS